MANGSRPWAEDEQAFLAANCYKLSWEEIGQRLGRTISAVRVRAQITGLTSNSKLRKIWTPEEIRYLEASWGKIPVSKIIKTLGRSYNSIIWKVNDLGLGRFIDNSNYFTVRQISVLLGVSEATVGYWVQTQGLKARRDLQFVCVRVNTLLEWLKNNQDKWNSDKLGINVLGPEPEWLKNKRAADAKQLRLNRGPWTPEEDAVLVRMYKAGYRHMDIAKELNRSLCGVQHRKCRLDIWGTGKVRPKDG